MHVTGSGESDFPEADAVFISPSMTKAYLVLGPEV